LNTEILITHYSKKDAWIVAIVLFGIVGPLVISIFFMAAGGPLHTAGVTTFLIAVLTGVTVLLLTYPLYYKITGDELVVRCGLLVNQHIPLSAIVLVQPTRNPLSAPAWSLDRLRVAYLINDREKFTLISPVDKLAFLRDLAAAAQGLTWNGQCLERQD
jgi:hypothetical protein